MYAAAYIINFLLIVFGIVGGVLFNCALHYGSLMAVVATLFIGAGIYMFNFGIRIQWWAAPGAVAIASALIWLVW